MSDFDDYLAEILFEIVKAGEFTLDGTVYSVSVLEPAPRAYPADIESLETFEDALVSSLKERK